VAVAGSFGCFSLFSCFWWLLILLMQKYYFVEFGLELGD
jgi:hypothetical protein